MGMTKAAGFMCRVVYYIYTRRVSYSVHYNNIIIYDTKRKIVGLIKLLIYYNSYVYRTSDTPYVTHATRYSAVLKYFFRKFYFKLNIF